MTIAKIVALTPDQTIVLPADFLAAMRPKEAKSNVVMILAPATKILRIIPTKSPEVLKVVIELSDLSPDFLHELGRAFLQLNIKTLYSTGLCFTQDTCVYEGYIDASEVKVPEKQLKGAFVRIKGVFQVDIERLKTE